MLFTPNLTPPTAPADPHLPSILFGEVAMMWVYRHKANSKIMLMYIPTNTVDLGAPPRVFLTWSLGVKISFYGFYADFSNCILHLRLES